MCDEISCCEYCGDDYPTDEAFEDIYCSEMCWEAATDYGEED